MKSTTNFHQHFAQFLSNFSPILTKSRTNLSQFLKTNFGVFHHFITNFCKWFQPIFTNTLPNFSPILTKSSTNSSPIFENHFRRFFFFLTINFLMRFQPIFTNILPNFSPILTHFWPFSRQMLLPLRHLNRSGWHVSAVDLYRLKTVGVVDTCQLLSTSLCYHPLPPIRSPCDTYRCIKSSPVIATYRYIWHAAYISIYKRMCIYIMYQAYKYRYLSGMSMY